MASKPAPQQAPVEDPELEKGMRAHAKRNHEKLRVAAGVVVAEQGADASLEEISRRAGLGSATLYRHYPTRLILLDIVFHDRVEALVAETAPLVSAADPGDALITWLRTLVRHFTANLGLAKFLAMAEGAKELTSAHAQVRDTGKKLLSRAQKAKAVNADATIADLLRLVNAIVLSAEREPATITRLLDLAIAGIRR
ncbi:TetR/AcrR family transcriptional regulator [Actinokineospora globicatena]|uniref:TetR/AcrR family transcriptional regulator n=1 Tax=Actinokineospora globicatena TaxID=103729 RepID=UPI0020A3E9A8|nr:TetR/AcrR family transcriptional regulator [Actinokineospora globicatena]MCP2306505.1 transcriptional regulator, TetR family [Actinokineospora globicatena]GLW81936.1 TetR family transcriptional regulator [Actinokineospora globicatena]GLW88730.1 TetR family transcriptional regulator [Actinokineospora globicatena]